MLRIVCLYLILLFPLSSFAIEKNISISEDYKELIDLYFAAARTGDDQVLKQFLDAGFPVNQINNQSYTALMVAAYYGHLSSIELLLKKGADPCIQDKRGNTAIMAALIKGELLIVKRLYQVNCSENIKNNAGLTLKEFARIYGQSDLLNSNDKEKK